VTSDGSRRAGLGGNDVIQLIAATGVFWGGDSAWASEQKTWPALGSVARFIDVVSSCGDIMIALLTALVLFAQASPAEVTAASGSGAAPKAEAKPEAKTKVNPDKVVCHEEAVVGSRFPRKVCQTQRSEAMKRQEDQETIRHMQDLSQINSH